MSADAQASGVHSVSVAMQKLETDSDRVHRLHSPAGLQCDLLVRRAKLLSMSNALGLPFVLSTALL